MQSLLAKTIQDVLDRSGYFKTRAEWAKFLGVPEASLEDWVCDWALPHSHSLKMMHDAMHLATNHSPFVELFDKPINEITPFGSLIPGGTLRSYFREGLTDQGARLRVLHAAEQKRSLETGSWYLGARK